MVVSLCSLRDNQESTMTACTSVDLFLLQNCKTYDGYAPEYLCPSLATIIVPSFVHGN